MIEEIFSSEPCEKGQFTNDGKAILFLKRCNEEDRIQLFKCDLNGANICPMPCPKEGDITELYVSKDKPHYVIQHSGGAEVHTLTFYNIDSDEELKIMKEHEKARQRFGAWKENGFEFFEQNMDNEVEWNLRQYTVENGGEPTTIKNTGYDPDYIGKNNENVRFISNQHGRWYHALNGGEPQDHRIRCGKQNQNGELYCIYERADGHFANIIRLSDDTNFQDIVISDEEIMKLISEDNNRIFPHGELNDFIILKNGDILLHIYKKGVSELYLKSKDQITMIDLSEITNALKFDFFIEDLDYSPVSGLIMCISTFFHTSHMWHLDLEKLQVNQYDETISDITLEGELENRTYDFEGNVTPDIQYFELKPKCNSNKTVIFFHGGPAVQTSGKFNQVIATFISKGFRVIAPNPAGSIGRGPAFAELDNGENRIPRFEEEIIPFVQWIIDNSNGPVFIHGGSYGGWIVNMLATSEIGEQIAAASTRNGLGSLTEFFDATARWRRKNRSIEYLGHCSLCNHDIDEQLNCERCKEIKISLSPFSNGGDLTIPQLIMFVGKKDSRVPWELSRDFVAEHRIEGEEFPQLYPPFENEGHKIKRKGNLIEIMNNIVNLFNDIEE